MGAVRLARAACFASLVVLAANANAGSAGASGTPTIEPYGQVARFGGLADGAGTTYDGKTTPEVEAGKLVDPVGMAVDTNDTSDTTPGDDKYAIYILENINPQAMNRLTNGAASAEALKLEYRIQKLTDAGVPLASVQFTLPSSEAERGVQANAIAVDGTDGRVYVLISDDAEGKPEADRIDVWNTTALSPIAAPGHEDSATGTEELVGPEAPAGTANVANIDGASLAVAGTGAGADLALGGTEYGTGPVIERFFTEAKDGHQPGELDGAVWHEAAKTEDDAAQAWGQPSQFLDWLSANPDGSFDAVLGPLQEKALYADNEPNMAWVGADLSEGPRPILPWADAAEGASVTAVDVARAATVGFKSDQENGAEYHRVAETGATYRAGVLGPSVAGLSGNGSDFSNGVYAGLVAHPPNEGSTWTLDQTSNDLAIRVFDEHEHSLAMIGNTTPGEPCNLEGGPGADISGAYVYGSFAAVVAGREGTVFALIQSDLAGKEEPTKIEPGNTLGAGGDEVVEFAPGAGQNGKPGVECPQPLFPAPTETFSITNVSTPADQLPSTGEVTIEKDTKLEFDASNADLQDGAQLEYDWSFENNGEVPEQLIPWRIEGSSWLAAPAQTTHEYKNTGSFETTLDLVNDFGVLKAQRKVHVAEAKPCHAAFTVIGTALGQPTSLDASSTTCEGQDDGVKVYSWEFGDGKLQSTPNPTVQHEYTEPGVYPVKLTVTDDFGHKFSEESSVTIAKEETPTSTQTTSTPQPTTTPHTTTQPAIVPPVVRPKPLTTAQKLAQALAECKKKPHKQRASCEKQARKKYAPPKHKSTKSKSKHGK
jgi:PKD repeat protein